MSVQCEFIALAKVFPSTKEQHDISRFPAISLKQIVRCRPKNVNENVFYRNLQQAKPQKHDTVLAHF